MLSGNRLLAWMGLFLVGLACSDSGAPTPPPPSITPKALQIVSGDGQRALRGGDLAAPLRVRLIGSDDEPLSGTAVQWTVTEGQATIDPAQSTTGPSGEAETRVTLGATLGSVPVAVPGWPPL